MQDAIFQIGDAAHTNWGRFGVIWACMSFGLQWNRRSGTVAGWPNPQGLQLDDWYGIGSRLSTIVVFIRHLATKECTQSLGNCITVAGLQPPIMDTSPSPITHHPPSLSFCWLSGVVERLDRQSFSCSM